MSGKVLVVEDEPAVTELIVVNLTQEGFSVSTAEDAESAWKLLTDSKPNVVLVDWMLPGVSGFQFIRHLRADERVRDIPVVMVTARHEEVDMISALEAGADDYVIKPFSPRELVARVKAVMRRRHPQLLVDAIELGGLRLVPMMRKVLARGQSITLGPTEFRLLHFLMTHSERVHTRTQLLDQVWGNDSIIEERTVDVHIRRLRSVLQYHELDRLVQTVRGTGYRFSTRSEN